MFTFEIFHLQHVTMVKKSSSFKTKFIANNAKAIRGNHKTLWCLTFPRFEQQNSRYKVLLGQFGAQDLPFDRWGTWNFVHILVIYLWKLCNTLISWSTYTMISLKYIHFCSGLSYSKLIFISDWCSVQIPPDTQKVLYWYSTMSKLYSEYYNGHNWKKSHFAWLFWKFPIPVFPLNYCKYMLPLVNNIPLIPSTNYPVVMRWLQVLWLPKQTKYWNEWLISVFSNVVTKKIKYAKTDTNAGCTNFITVTWFYRNKKPWIYGNIKQVNTRRKHAGVNQYTIGTLWKF